MVRHAEFITQSRGPIELVGDRFDQRLISRPAAGENGFVHLARSQCAGDLIGDSTHRAGGKIGGRKFPAKFLHPFADFIARAQ